MTADFAAARRMTLDEWSQLEEDVDGELVDGRLVEEEMPTPLHEMVVAWLLRFLGSYAAERRGVAFGSELKMRVAESRGRKADVVVYLPGRPMPGRNVGATKRPPSIVVEVLSPQPRDVRRDVVDKKKEYAAFGVDFYWLIDPQSHVVEVLELGRDGRYASALVAAEGKHPVPGCDGLTMDIDEMWDQASLLPDDEAD